MPKENVVVGLDIGTTKATICVGQVSEGLINIIGFSRVPNNGLRRGIVVDIEDTVSAITSALEEAERMSGVPITSAQVAIGGYHITSTVSKGVVAVSRADGEISKNDVNRVMEAARTVALPPNREILHVIPKYFTVDGQTNLAEPVGMTGIRLEVEAAVVSGSTAAIKNLSKCVNQAGLKIEEMIFSPIAAGKLLLNKKQKELGVVLIDIGGGTTSMALYESGDILHCAVIPVGSMHITNDIAIGLRTSLEIAEKVKIKYGCAVPGEISESEMINLANFDQTDNQRVERRYVAEIIHARLMEIFSLIRDELRKVGKDGMLPAGIVFTGGGSKLEGLVGLAKEELRLPAQLGETNIEIAGVVDKLDYAIYSTSVGLILNGFENQGENHNILMLDGGVIDKAKSFFKQFLP